MNVPEDIEKEIRKGYSVFEYCCNNDEPEKMVSEFFTPQVLFGATGVELATGTSEVFEIVDGLGSAVDSVAVEVLEIRTDDCGELAYAVVNVHIVLPDGGKRIDRALCVWRKTAVGWRVDADWAVLGEE